MKPNGYESLIAKLRLILLTQVYKQLSAT